MEAEEKIIGQSLCIGYLNNCLLNFEKGKGSILAISGDTGLGKTFFLSQFEESYELTDNSEKIFVQCQPPIGHVKISSMQPLLPFQRILERLEERKKSTAKSRLAFDIGMSTLSAIPIGGDVFYLVKEVREALEKYKKDKKKETSVKLSIGAEFYFNSIKKFIDKKKLVIFLDDFHWSDSQSVELMKFLAENISELPLLIVFSFNPAIIEQNASPLILFLEQQKENNSFILAQLESFSMQEIRQASKYYLTGYKSNKEFEDWLLQKSYGVPSVVTEYLKYFQKNPPFTADDELIDSFGTQGYLPGTVHSAFSETIDKLSEEEKNIFAVCSSEGREFTAVVISNLLNTDVLTTIKKLRHLQNKTRIIKSLGAKVRYGQTTTVYEFTQAFYHSYFENSLEYEETLALHGQIAALLKQKYDDAENEAVRQQIAPYVAAHSISAGDDETAGKMLLVTAQAAKEYGSTEIMQEVYESYKQLTEKKSDENKKVSSVDIGFNDLLNKFQKPVLATVKNESGEKSDDLSASQLIDFNTLRRVLIDNFLDGDFDEVSDKALTYLNASANNLRVIEQAQLLSFAARAFIEVRDYSSSLKYLNQALLLPELNKEPIAESFVFNTASIYYFNDNKLDEAISYLKRAAQRAIKLPPEIRLMTLSNIALIQSKIEPEKSKKYMSAIKKLTRQLSFDELDQEISLN